MTERDDLPLAAAFPPATRAQWQKLVDAVLKGAPRERLTSTTYDGIKVEPLPDRMSDAGPVVGRAPAQPWQVMARIEHPDPAAANAEALQELENGAGESRSCSQVRPVRTASACPGARRRSRVRSMACISTPGSRSTSTSRRLRGTYRNASQRW